MLADIIGLLGASLVVISYALLQMEKINTSSSFWLYSNLIGSILLLFSLFYNWNLASVAIEVIWLIVALYGIIKRRNNEIRTKNG